MHGCFKMPNLKILSLISSSCNLKQKTKTKIDVFTEQIIDSCIVGGIAGLSAYVASGESATVKVFALAFGLTFLFKLKEYRKL